LRKTEGARAPKVKKELCKFIGTDIAESLENGIQISIIEKKFQLWEEERRGAGGGGGGEDVISF